MLAKAFAGFTNGDGGIVVIGTEAKQGQKGDPDLISGEQPVADAMAVKARIEALVGELVEPPLQNVRLAAVLDQPGSKAGFVLVHVPPTDGFPARSRKDWHFYQRIASGTYRMEYFQIADMFDSRPDAEGDIRLGNTPQARICFNPRPPRGERQPSCRGYGSLSRFQSTPPTRRRPGDGEGVHA